jgi:hypothetical protein
VNLLPGGLAERVGDRVEVARARRLAPLRKQVEVVERGEDWSDARQPDELPLLHKRPCNLLPKRLRLLTAQQGWIERRLLASRECSIGGEVIQLRKWVLIGEGSLPQQQSPEVAESL